ncbi:MAG: hypothetical protein ACYS0I_07120 [Planctomycetota bacterium]|jgi:hypothetical protein
MKSRNSPTGIESDDSAVLHYESLRSQVLSKQERFAERSLGLALFIRQGMLAWIKVCHRCIPANPKPIKRSKMPVFTYETTSEMIKVMANITLFNLQELHS